MTAKKKSTRSKEMRVRIAQKAGKANCSKAQPHIRAGHKVMVLKMRVEEGLEFRVIAERIKMSIGYAHGCFDEAMREMQSEGTELARRAKAEMTVRLDRMSRRLYVRLMDSELRVVDTSNGERGPMELADFEALTKLTAASVRVMERLAKLLGLDAAEKLELEGKAAMSFERIATMQRERKKE
jgi:hypothetical protein